MGFPILVRCHPYIESRPRNILVSASEGLRHLWEVNTLLAYSTLLTALPTTYLCLLFDKAKGWEWGRVLCCYTCLNVIAMGGRIFRTSYVHVWGEKGIHSGEYQLETAKRVLCKVVSANMNVDILISWFVMGECSCEYHYWEETWAGFHSIPPPPPNNTHTLCPPPPQQHTHTLCPSKLRDIHCVCLTHWPPGVFF